MKPSDAYICKYIGNLTIIVSENAGIFSIVPLATKFSILLIEIRISLLQKMPLKMSSGKWRPFCLGLNVLKLEKYIIMMWKWARPLSMVVNWSHYTEVYRRKCQNCDSELIMTFAESIQGPWLLRNFHIKMMLADMNFQTCLLIGWQPSDTCWNRATGSSWTFYLPNHLRMQRDIFAFLNNFTTLWSHNYNLSSCIARNHLFYMVDTATRGGALEARVFPSSPGIFQPQHQEG